MEKQGPPELEFQFRNFKLRAKGLPAIRAVRAPLRTLLFAIALAIFAIPLIYPVWAILRHITPS